MMRRRRASGALPTNIAAKISSPVEICADRVRLCSLRFKAPQLGKMLRRLLYTVVERPMSVPETKVRVEHVSKIFGNAPQAALERLEAGAPKDRIYAETGSVVAVADVSFEVGQGEIFVVMGLSGSGKSTLVRCINRLIDPTGGRLYIDDEDVVAVDDERLRQIRLSKIAMVFQHFALFPHKSVAENVEYGLKIKGVDAKQRRERALRSLDMVGLRAWADAAPDNLSGGMQQRVGLARALAVDPEVLLMDEPFSALDPLIRRDMQKELIELQRRLRMTIIFITHDLHEALTIGDHIAIMKDGRFVQVGNPEEIVAAPSDPYVVSFIQDVDRGRVLSARVAARPAPALPLAQATLAEARAHRASAEHEVLYLTDDAGRPVGALLDDGLAVTPEGSELKSLMRKEFSRVRETTKLADLFELCARGEPIALLDEDGRLCGMVRPLDVFRQLAANGEAGPEGPATQAAPTAAEPVA
jgi:glycine betaine/proline transport system ATP-binding protein